MEPDDPWYWDVDRVVREFCTSKRTWTAPPELARLPDPREFEKKISEHEIDGPTLLNIVDEAFLEKECEIATPKVKVAYKVRYTIIDAIRQFQKRSPKYQEHCRSKQKTASRQATPEKVDDGNSPNRQQPSGTEESPATTAGDRDLSTREGIGSVPLPHKQDVSAPAVTADKPSNGIDTEAAVNNVPDVSFQGGEPEGPGMNGATSSGALEESPDTIQHAEPTNIRREFDSAAFESTAVHRGSELTGPEPVAEMNSAVALDLSPKAVVPEAPAAEVKKKPKRLAPTLISTELDHDRDRELRTEADHVILHHPDRFVPHAVTLGKDGRKRLAPNLVSPTTSGSLISGGIASLETAKELVKAVAAKQARAKSDLSKGYLGSVEMPVDDIFFHDTANGSSCEQPEPEDNFAQLSASVSSGRRLYIARRMKYFLTSRPQKVKRGSKTLLARCPYPDYLASGGKPTSFMLARKTDDGNIAVTKENVAQWPELDAGGIKSVEDDDERLATFNLPSGEIALGGPSSYDQFDPEKLRKWQHMERDKELPIYGESGSENEYDAETWNEMLDEFGPKEMLLLPSKSKPLTQDEVNEAMDQGMAILQVKWHDNVRPKMERRAYGIWMKYRHRKREKIAELRDKLNLLDDSRIPKMREEILKQVWTRPRQVHQQCHNMEQSIFDREEIDWEISVLKRKTKPDKPPPLPKKEKRDHAARQADKEADLEHSESLDSTSEDDQEDPLLDFIITDDEMDVDEDTVMAEDSSSQSDESDVADDSTASAMIDDMELDNQLTEAQDADDEDEEEDVKIRTPSRRRYQVLHSAQQAVVDLTGDSPAPSARDPSRSASEVIDLITPSKKVSTANASQSATAPGRKLFQRGGVEPPNNETISLSSDEELGEDGESAPPFDEPTRVAEYGMPYWKERGDKERMLVTRIAKIMPETRKQIWAYLDALAEDGDESIWDDMRDVMIASRDGKTSARGLADNTFCSVTGLIRLFELYTDGEEHRKRKFFDQTVVKKLLGRHQHVTKFLDVCRQALSGLQPAEEHQASDRDESPTPTQPGRPRIRVRPVFQDPRAQKARNANEHKVAEQQKRREKLRQRLAEAPLSDISKKLIINEAKEEHEGLIFVHPHIAGRIKAHQLEGIRFMWGQIVSKMGSEELQGCLLAHTMGLGKTMQVITLLVAIAEAASSEDPTVSSQIPSGLRTSKTLILCPPGLLDNWMDELDIWVPEDVLPKIGSVPGEEFRKVTAAMDAADRLAEITSWYETGGILVMGFRGFETIVSTANAAREESDSKSLSPPDGLDYEKACMQLLTGPNVVIADEAHKLKNSNSKVNQAATKFRTNSRIALTGSPLSNNVEEYHSMVNWVAPNYLGPIVEFRAKYVEPIQAGLYYNSTRAERKRAKRMLQVLNRNIAPKVNRCGVDVLKNDLPPKTEFIISVPLTDLQRELYRLYVDINQAADLTRDQVTKEGIVKQTTLWAWLGMLGLLCNHPGCFRNRVQAPNKVVKNSKRKGKAKKELVDADNTPDVEVELESPPAEVKNMLAEQVTAMMGDYEALPMARQHSYKISVICHILDAARKANDKVLVFSQSIPTIDFLEKVFKQDRRKVAKLTGSTAISTRQGAVKDFNTNDMEVYLISTTAGGVGLNLYGANRVIIVDSKWSPAHEEQAIGRAYRLGQRKHVFVYRLVVGGTFEEKMHNQTVFKTQLAAQVVDKKDILANARREKAEYLSYPKEVEREDLSEFVGNDPLVLDKILALQDHGNICHIQMSEAFNRPDDEGLDADDHKEIERELADEKLKRDNPQEWQARRDARAAEQRKAYQAAYDEQAARSNNIVTNRNPPPPSSAPPATNGAPQSFPSMVNYHQRPSNQMPRAKEPIMGSGTRMVSPGHLDSPSERAIWKKPTILDTVRPPKILDLEAQLISALSSNADTDFDNMPLRAAEVIDYIRRQRPNESHYLDKRIDDACVAFRKYKAPTNDLLSGRRSVSTIVNEVLEEHLDGPAPINPLYYAPAIEPVSVGDGNPEREERPLTLAEKLRKGVEAGFTSRLRESVKKTVDEYPYLKLDDLGDEAEVAKKFVHEIDSAVRRKLNKQRDGDELESVVFARASDFIMKRLKDTSLFKEWMVGDRLVTKFVGQEMREFLRSDHALDPESPRPKKSSTSTKVLPRVTSTPTSQDRTPAHKPNNSSRKSKPAQLDGADSATDRDDISVRRHETRILPPSSPVHRSQHTPLSAQSLVKNLTGQKKKMPWHNKPSRIGTETPVLVPQRSRPFSSTNQERQSPFGTTSPASYESPVPPPRPSERNAHVAAKTKTPMEIMQQPSGFKEALNKQAPSIQSPSSHTPLLPNGKRFQWARSREHTPEDETSTVSGTPTSTLSLQSSTQPQPASKKQKTGKEKDEKKMSSLPSWAKREVQSSQGTPRRTRVGRSASIRSGRSTPGPNVQP